MVVLSEVQAALAERPPTTAMVLGSGLSVLSEGVEVLQAWPFSQLPMLVSTTVVGHKGRLVYGVWEGCPVLIFEGRIHFYEGHGWEATQGPVKLAAALGVSTVLLTNAAGGIRSDLTPGQLMLIKHHVKWTQPHFWRYGVNKTDTMFYDDRLNDEMRSAARSAQVELQEGIYAMLTGPCYETPAEIRALRAIGVDAVGMSTAVEAETAYRHNLRCAAISCITNQAAGLSETPPHHEEVLIESRKAANRMRRLLATFLQQQMTRS